MDHSKQTAIFALAVAFLSGCSPSPQSAERAAEVPTNALASDQSRNQPKTYDGPFGLIDGLTPAEVEKVVPGLTHDEGTFYISQTVPTPHTSFESYMLQFSSKSGLCSITGIGNDINSGGRGLEIRSVFDDLDNALTEKYGKGKKYDRATGLMDDLQYWMIALSSKDRILAKFWNKDEGSNLPANISSIMTQAHASNMSTGFVNLKYEFSNISDCAAEQNQSKNKAL